MKRKKKFPGKGHLKKTHVRLLILLVLVLAIAAYLFFFTDNFKNQASTYCIAKMTECSPTTSVCNCGGSLSAPQLMAGKYYCGAGVCQLKSLSNGNGNSNGNSGTCITKLPGLKTAADNTLKDLTLEASVFPTSTELKTELEKNKIPALSDVCGTVNINPTMRAGCQTSMRQGLSAAGQVVFNPQLIKIGKWSKAKLGIDINLVPNQDHTTAGETSSNAGEKDSRKFSGVLSTTKPGVNYSYTASSNFSTQQVGVTAAVRTCDATTKQKTLDSAGKVLLSIDYIVQDGQNTYAFNVTNEDQFTAHFDATVSF